MFQPSIYNLYKFLENCGRDENFVTANIFRVWLGESKGRISLECGWGKVRESKGRTRSIQQIHFMFVRFHGNHKNV